VFSVKIWTHKSSVLTEAVLSLFTAVRPHGEMGADADVHGINCLALYFIVTVTYIHTYTHY